jgi:hypothetical protein
MRHRTPDRYIAWLVGTENTYAIQFVEVKSRYRERQG